MLNSSSQSPADPASVRTGRKPSTSRGQLEQHALRLFADRGFDEVTVEDIASAAGIGRRTFFRYYRSKNDVVWGDFDGELQRMRELLAAYPRRTPMMDALRETIVEFNRIDAAQLPWHRLRMSLILEIPALQAHSTLRYASWRAVVAEFAAHRLGQPHDALLPQLVAHVCLGASVAAYQQWLRQDERGDQGAADLCAFLDEAHRAIGPGLQAYEPRT
ncbi:mycofactocin system transcriptional regulator [Streptomyces sp. NPDC059893]|uniref:mycofactocin system transcriptional regulator n=1 Tax=Streptomyces sp. NPDC059893 TaxID=3346990 RepID=UPI0036597BB9